jgi:hypothetical protein
MGCIHGRKPEPDCCVLVNLVRQSTLQRGGFEFNKNSTPMKKVELFYQTIPNGKMEKASVFKALRHFTKR